MPLSENVVFSFIGGVIEGIQLVQRVKFNDMVHRGDARVYQSYGSTVHAEELRTLFFVLCSGLLEFP